MIYSIEKQIKLLQEFIRTIEPICTKPEVLKQAYARLAELQGQTK